MSLSTKILIWLGAVLVLGALGFIVYKQLEISRRQDAIEQNVVAQKQLIDGIVRSQASWATRDDVENFAKNNDINIKAIKDDLDKLHAEISAVNVAVTTSKGQTGTHVPTTTGPNTNPNPVDPTNPDPFGYMKQQQTLALNEDFGTVKVPIGSVGFSAWQKEPWNYDIKAREYRAATVVGTDENQRQYFYNKFTVKVDNKEYTLPITTASTQQVYPEAKFHWFNPRLYLTTGGAINLTQAPLQGSANIGATFGIMSYGQFKNTPAISILQVGVCYETGTQRASVILNPVNINIGGIFPKGLVNSAYVGPSTQIDTGGNIFVGPNLSVGL